ncbi:unnamed protein product [Auanema sp. JU1783]|nr:unnamed protein product [Auanema sp. JU1783]
MFVNMPVNVLTSVICLISYLTFFAYVFKMKISAHNSKMWNEIQLCIQCVLMFVVFTTCWLTLAVFPQGSSEWRILLTICVVILFGADSFIYFILNREIKYQLRLLGSSVLNVFPSRVSRSVSSFYV